MATYIEAGRRSVNAASGAKLAREYQKGFQSMSGRATCTSKEYTPPKAPIAKGTFFPSVETPRRSPRLAAKRKATATTMMVPRQCAHRKQAPLSYTLLLVKH